jgi:transcriptional regulator with XRE-family HTH domain
MSPDQLRETLDYKSESIVELWLSGRSLPRLNLLSKLANALQLPLEDVLVPWLIDSDPENGRRYQIIAAQLMGLEVANDLLCGEPADSDAPWFTLRREGCSATEVVIGMGDDAPPGVFPAD